MLLDRIYCGAWLPRTMVHLSEIYNFLKLGQASPELDGRKLLELHRTLSVSRVDFIDDENFNSIQARCGQILVTITEDGAIIMMREVGTPAHDVAQLEQFYTLHLGPALAYLFSRGAPLPLQLTTVKEIYPCIVVGRNIAQSDMRRLLHELHDSELVSHHANGYRVTFGHASEIISVQHTNKKQSKQHTHEMDDLINYTIFVRGFEQLLTTYLDVHRSIWSEITVIRESRSIRHKNFPQLRMKILDTLATIAFVRARMSQMGNILRARDRMTHEELQKLLHTLGFSRFETLEATLEYTSNLWKMTEDYVNDTMSLLQSLVEENSQRELRVLQITTVAAAVTSFFGMNVAFPWNDEWASLAPSSYAVASIVLLFMLGFYAFIRTMILNRRFIINRPTNNK